MIISLLDKNPIGFISFYKLSLIQNNPCVLEGLKVLVKEAGYKELMISSHSYMPPSNYRSDLIVAWPQQAKPNTTWEHPLHTVVNYMFGDIARSITNKKSTVSDRVRLIYHLSTEANTDKQIDLIIKGLLPNGFYSLE